MKQENSYLSQAQSKLYSNQSNSQSSLFKKPENKKFEEYNFENDIYADECRIISADESKKMSRLNSNAGSKIASQKQLNTAQ